MDPYKQNEQHKPGDGQRPPQSAPSIDGFFPPNTGSQPRQPNHSQQFRTPPSRAPHPFQPAEFFKPPPLPNLPKIADTPPRRAAEEPKRQGLRDILSVGGVLASALLLAFFLINFVFQSYQVDGPSMRATLENRDHLIVWKVDRTLANFTNGTYIPNRGDVIVFNEPSGAEPGGVPGKQLIKRVIGLPGERVVYAGTEVTVYNKENPNGFNPDETMPYGEMIINERPSDVDVTVKEGEVFVSGDNRDNSLDSRAFGPLDADLIVGKLIVRILPLNTFKLF